MQVKDEQLKQFNKRLAAVEAEAEKAKKQFEEATKTLRDLSAQFVSNAKLDQQALARKSKELETVLREKKCTNCLLCVDDIKLKYSQQADGAHLVSQIAILNDNLVAKAAKISELEESQRQASLLISQTCSYNYRILQNKTNDFLRQQDSLRQKYELKLM